MARAMYLHRQNSVKAIQWDGTAEGAVAILHTFPALKLVVLNLFPDGSSPGYLKLVTTNVAGKEKATMYVYDHCYVIYYLNVYAVLPDEVFCREYIKLEDTSPEQIAP